MSETDVDVRNVEAWAEVIKDVLCLVPIERRLAVLTLVTKKAEAECAEYEAHDGLVMICAADIGLDTPGVRHQPAIQRLRSLIIQVFTRRIKTSNSPAEAAKILYARHRHGHGSRLLEDYLPRIPA